MSKADLNVESIEEEDEELIEEDTIETTAATNNAAMEEDEVDMENGEEVVKRYEVFLSQNLATNLMLFQYPLRPREKQYDYNTLKQMRFKKNHKRVDLDFEMSTKGEHYDRDTEHTQTTMTLTSSNTPLKANYAVGVLRGNQLHITPLQSILQLRPNTEYLADDVTAKEKVIGKKGEKEKKAAAPSIVTMRTKQEELRRQKTYEYMKEQEDLEPPVKIELFNKDTMETSAVFERLFENSFTPVDFDLTPKIYLDNLVPYKADPLDAIRSRIISLDAIKNVDPSRQVQLAILAGKTLHYNRIKELAFKCKSDEQVLAALELMANIVDGRWVAKSEAVEPTPRLQAARDYMLYLFETQQYVCRKDFFEKTKNCMGEEKAKEMLESIAVMVDTPPEIAAKYEGGLAPMSVWVFKIPKDEDFANRFPEKISKHQKEWKGREPVIQKNVQLFFKNIPVVNRKVSSISRPGAPSAHGIPMMRAAPQPDETEKKIKAFLSRLFQTNGVCNMAVILADWALQQKTEQLFKGADEVMKKCLAGMTMPFNGAYILKASMKPEYEKFRKVVIPFFEKNKGKIIKKEDILQHVKEETKEDIPPGAFSFLTKELGAPKGKGWVTKTGAETSQK